MINDIGFANSTMPPLLTSLQAESLIPKDRSRSTQRLRLAGRASNTTTNHMRDELLVKLRKLLTARLSSMPLNANLEREKAVIKRNSVRCSGLLFLDTGSLIC